MKKDISAEYDSAAVPASETGGDFASQYDQAPADPATAEAAPEAAGELSIPPEAVGQMKALKESGDMAGLGAMVAQYLN
jgi:hypothetical protein